MIQKFTSDLFFSRLLYERIISSGLNEVGIFKEASRLITSTGAGKNTEALTQRAWKRICDAVIASQPKGWIEYFPTYANDTIRCIKDWDDQFNLILAAWLGLDDVVGACLENGVSADLSHELLGNALYAAAFNDHENIARLLINKGAHVQRMCRPNADALQLAAYRGSRRVVRLLLTTDADVRDWTCMQIGHGPFGNPLGAAAAAGHVDIVHSLLQRGNIELNSGDWQSRTPLFRAAEYGRANVVKYMLGLPSISLIIKDTRMRTPFAYAVDKSCQYLFNFILRQYPPGPDGAQLLLRTITGLGHVEVIRLFLSREDVCPDWDCALNHIPKRIFYQYMDVVESLFECEELRFDSPKFDIAKGRLLSWAASIGRLRIVKSLLQLHNTNPNGCDRDGWSAICCAIASGHIDVVRILLATDGIELNGDVGWRRSIPLVAATRHKNIEIFRLLLEDKRVIPDINIGGGRTALMCSVVHGQLDMFQALILRGCDPNSKNDTGLTSLHYAAIHGRIDIVEYLLSRPDIQPNTPSINGDTPLHQAVLNGQGEVVDVLLDSPLVDPNVANDDGYPPLFYAKESMSILLCFPFLVMSECFSLGNGKLIHSISHPFQENTIWSQDC
ncbi:ankyrin [Arthroderma uncinatum]|uniref:ankyrin n=1 Tax=Arthroderma uncinatum TaxID=74035 RepID=UPI00144AB5C7|nr:ankyrin [Arthroderma uncinatum]KAF3480866.1 ankyrin [Arthroderma uncinatum]